MTKRVEDPATTDTKLTLEVERTLLFYVRQGAPLETAAAAAGVSPTTLRIWLRRGARGEAGYKRFHENVGKAHGETLAGLAARIKTAGGRDWRPNAYLLERLDRANWGRDGDSHKRMLLVVFEALEEVLKPDDVDRAVIAIERGLRRAVAVKQPAPADEAEREEDP